MHNLSKTYKNLEVNKVDNNFTFQSITNQDKIIDISESMIDKYNSTNEHKIKKINTQN